jgi:polysaccharide deacetylase 2 family uncharacterized protein YibQ
MAQDKRRAREIAQAQKQREAEKAAAALPSARVRLDRKVTIRIDPDRFDQLEDYARREGFTVSLVVRHLVCRFLEDRRRDGGNR